MGEGGVWNPGPGGPPIELAEVGQVLAVARGKQSLLREVREGLALALREPSSPWDVRRKMGPNLDLVKGEQLFREDMGRRVDQLHALVAGEELSSLDTLLLRKARLRSRSPLGGGERTWRGRRQSRHGVHIRAAEGGRAKANQK